MVPNLMNFTSRFTYGDETASETENDGKRKKWDKSPRAKKPKMKSARPRNMKEERSISLSLPHFPSVTKPKDYPPQLPRIYDEYIAQQYFTHFSYKTDLIYEPNNSILEWKGEALVNVAAIALVDNCSPDTDVRVLKSLRDHLVSNENLRHYAMMDEIL
jgi:dsRNA-specific ribonuclease